MKFDEVESQTPNLRVSPAFKLALRAAANHQLRRMISMLEILAAGFCDAKGVAIPGRKVARDSSCS